MSEIKKGDGVVSKNGGLFMVVDQVGVGKDAEAARCVWSEGKRRKKGIFALSDLKKVVNAADPSKRRSTISVYF